MKLSDKLSNGARIREDRSRFLPILAVWRPFYILLGLGVLIAIFATMSALILMGFAAKQVAIASSASAVGAIALRALGAGRVVSRYCERYFTHDAMFRALTATRVWFFRHLARVSAHGIGFMRSGDLLSRLVNDIDMLDNLYLRLVVPVFGALVTLVTIFYWAGLLSWSFALILGVIYVLMTFGLPLLYARRFSVLDGLVLQRQAALRNASLDYATGLREAAIYGGENRLASSVASHAEKLMDAGAREAKRQDLASMWSYLAGQSMIVISLVFSGLFCGAAGQTLDAIILIFLLLTGVELSQNLVRAGALFGKLRHAAQRVTMFVSQGKPDHSGGLRFDLDFQEICLNHVSFRWQEKRPYVIENCSLTLRRGQRVAVIGPSGAGKSTLVAMLLRVVEPETGELTIDGHSYNAFDIRDLRKNVAWLSQTTHIFADTIRNNLCLGGCHYPEEALWNALSQAGLAHVVKDLPDGLDSWVGEGGKTLSGGEGRRLVLARILLSDAPIIILDEPTTGLDAETAESFFKTFEAATKDKTVLLVLHRLTGAEKLDLVWKLGDGHVKVSEAS